MPIRRNRPKPENFNRDANLAFQLRLEDFEIAIQDVYDLFYDVNTGLLEKGLERLDDFLRPAIMSGLLSDLLTASLSKHSRALTRNNYFNGHPDLVVKGIYPNDSIKAGTEGVEIKTTRKSGGAVDTHGARDQWMAVFVYESDNATEPARERAPAKVSSTVPSPSGNTARTIFRMNACGFRLGCGASARSCLRVGADAITSPNGWSFEGRRNPPVFHRRRLSCTRPSIGLRKISHGSHIERGMTLTSVNSVCAALGRSPPRIVIVKRMISPRRSNPARVTAFATTNDRSGLDAIKTCAPGTTTGRSSRAQAKKNRSSSMMLSRISTVKRGSGARLLPSNDGGMRQTPPRPLRSLACSC